MLRQSPASQQCDQKKIAKYLKKLPKNDYTRKMIGFGTFTKIAINVRDLGKLIVAKGFKSCPKSNKSSNLVTLPASLNLVTADSTSWESSKVGNNFKIFKEDSSL